jgi:nucleoside-diphosphate-sugar epimerase
MLTHLLSPGEKPRRAVVLGAAGFVGSAALRHLKAAGIETLGLSRGDVDLASPGGADALKKRLMQGDALVFASARAPCRDAAMLVENVRMAGAVCAAIKEAEVAHLVYVSSDAVYKDSADALSEASCAEPGSPHGAMHLAREVLLRSEFAGPFAILRPTLIYGLHDPHNGYGPNRFRRLASAGADIVLFGNGEERRDHVHVEDVAELLSRIVQRGSTGILNAVSGDVASFREIAEFTVAQFSPQVSIIGSPRKGPMPHNGLRPFDAAEIVRAFPDFHMTQWRDGIASTCRIPATT